VSVSSDSEKEKYEHKMDEQNIENEVQQAK
jgi:hypothetical protein